MDYKAILEDHIEFNQRFVSGFFTLTVKEDFTCKKYELEYLTTLGEDDDKIKEAITTIEWNELVEEAGNYGGHLLFTIMPEEEHQAGYYLIEAVSLGKVVECEHENEIMRQGNGFVYGECGDCGEDLY